MHEISRSVRLARGLLAWPATPKGSAAVAAMAFRWLAGLLLALPLAGLVGRTVVRHPASEQLLWSAGGVWLVEAARLAAPGFRAVASGLALTAVACCFAWLLPLGALIATWAAPDRGGSRRQAWRRAAGHLPSLCLMLGLWWLVQALATAPLLLGARALSRHLGPAGRAGAWLALATVVACGLLAWIFAVVHDLWRVHLVVGDLPLLAAARAAWSSLRRRPVATLVAAGWRAGLAVSLLGCGLVAGWRVDPAGRAVALTTVVVQQVPVIAWVLLRASWFAWVGRQLAPGEGARSPAAADPASRAAVGAAS